MNLKREPSIIAKAAAEEVRALNHRTFDRQAFPEPSEIYSTIAGLTQLVQGLPQAIEQTWQQLRAMEEANEIRMDDGSDVQVEAEVARQDLSEARRMLVAAAESLNRAARPLSHMGGQW